MLERKKKCYLLLIKEDRSPRLQYSEEQLGFADPTLPPPPLKAVKNRIQLSIFFPTIKLYRETMVIYYILS